MRLLRASPVACFVVGLAAAAVSTAQATLQAVAQVPSGPTADLSPACTAVALAGITLLLCWLAVAVAVTAVDLLVRARAPRVRRRTAPLLSPWLVRRLVAAALGLATVAAVSPAQAATTPRPAAVSTTYDAPAPALDRPAAWAPAAPAHRRSSLEQRSTGLVTGGAPRAAADPIDEVVVRRGDSLWSIAERHLRSSGRPHTTADIAQEWPRWWAANARAIGSDPDLLHAGQRLTAPTA